jgi:hypothetical protein
MPRDRLLHFNRTLNYYLEVPYYFATLSSQGRLSWEDLRSVHDLTCHLHSEGITHIFFEQKSDPAGQIGSAHGASLLDVLLRDHAVLMYQSDRIVPQFRTLDRGRRQVRARVYRLSYPEGLMCVA